MLKRNSIFCVRILNFCDQFFTYLVVTREKKDRNSAGNRKYILEDDQYPFFFFSLCYVKAFAFVEVLTVAGILEFKSRGTWLNAGLPPAFSRSAKICAHSIYIYTYIYLYIQARCGAIVERTV